MSIEGALYRIVSAEAKASAMQKDIFIHRLDSTIASLKSCSLRRYDARPGKFYLVHENQEQVACLNEFCIVNELDPAKSFRIANKKNNIEVYEPLKTLLDKQVFNSENTPKIKPCR